MFRQIIRADVDGWVCAALAFVLEDFLDVAEDAEGPRLGDGSDFRDGEDWPLDLLSPSTEEDLLVLAMIPREQSGKHNEGMESSNTEVKLRAF